MPEPEKVPKQTGPSPDEFEQKYKALRKRLFIVAVASLVLIIVGGSFAFISWRQNKHRQSAEVLMQRRKTVVKQGLIDMLSVKQVQRKIQYEDDQHRIITWQFQNDLTDSRSPIAKGTVSISYSKQRDTIKQTMEFVSLKNKRGADLLYFRMIEGNEYTGASKEWYRGLQRDIRAMKEFGNFWWLKYDEINSIKGIVVVGNLQDTPYTSKLISEIQEDKAYEFKDCHENATSVWCNGKLIPSGIGSIDTSVAQSEGLSRLNLTEQLQSYHFTVWTSKGSSGISRFAYTPNNDNKDWTQSFWDINKPFDLATPQSSIDAPILGGYRATIDSACNDQCQKQHAQEELDRKSGNYY